MEGTLIRLSRRPDIRMRRSLSTWGTPNIKTVCLTGNDGSASTSHVGHTLSGSGIPNQPLGPSSQDSFWYDNYGNASGSSSSALTSIKFVSEWSRVIEDGTTFTMMGIKSS